MTAGVQLGYVSRILGHANVAVTAQHYARFVGDTYTRPVPVEPGEVPTDLIAKLANRLATELATDFKDISENGWKSLEIMERETGFEPATLSLGS